LNIQLLPNAQVAQLVEQRTENPRVGGSSPPLGTSFFNELDEKSIYLCLDLVSLNVIQ
jgi:hypothetical protein